MEKFDRRIINLSYIPMIIGLVGMISFIILIIKHSDFEILGYILMASIFFCIFAYGIFEFIRVKKKKKLLYYDIHYLNTIVEFNVLLHSILAEKNDEKYESLFLRTKEIDNPYLGIAKACENAIETLEQDSNVFYEWYNDYRLIDIYINKYRYIIKDLKKPFKRIPYQLKK